MAYPYPPPQQQPPPAGAQPAGYPQLPLASQVDALTITSGKAVSMFSHGNIILLQSNSSGQSLRIRKGEVEGKGGKGVLAQFTVHFRRPGVVALQNVGNPEHWLGIHEGRTIGTGHGGPYCEFHVQEVEERFVVLESESYPGQHIGILDNGSVKPPNQTGRGPHGKFIPTVVAQASPPQHYPATAPPPQQYPATAPPQQQYPAPTFPGQQPAGGYGAPPPAYQPHPPAPAPAPAPAQAPPSGPQLPSGFSIMDAFRDGNVVQLIARSNGYPIRITNASVFGNGTFTHTDSQFAVVAAPGTGPGVIMLNNINWKGLYIAIKKDKLLGNGKGKKHCHLRVHPHADNYVSFESLNSPHHFLAVAQDGSTLSPASVSISDEPAQFFVRTVLQKHPHSSTIMTPFGRPSLAIQLCDRSIIQLYLKGSNQYLSINPQGFIVTIGNGGDRSTMFELRDRGMGIYSFQHYAHEGFRLRMSNFMLQGKGDANVNADFRLKDNADNSVSFESVTCPGAFVAIADTRKRGQVQTNLSIFVVTIQKYGGSETVTKRPIN